MAESKHFFPHSYIQCGKREGSGFYSKNNTVYYDINQVAIPLVLDAVKSIELKSGSVFTLVDYGTADGGTSMPLMYACVEAIRDKYGDAMPITVIYEDQPVNDFKSLFLILQGFIPGTRSYLLDFSNVFVMASGTNFYSQCFPSNSVTIGFSGTAMHWLRDKPCDITDALYARLISVPEEKEQYHRQAEKDWELILMHRAAELIPGGKTIISLPTVDESTGFSSGCLTDQKVRIFPFFWDIWKQISDEGKITKEELKRTNVLAYNRSSEEIKKPFKCKDSPVMQAGLELVSMETRVIRLRVQHENRIGKYPDCMLQPENYVMLLRTWSNSAFMSGLSDSRSAEEKAQIVDELYRRYEADVVKRPEDHGMDYINAYIVVQKKMIKK